MNAEEIARDFLLFGRPDVTVVEVRGNVDTRLARENGRLDVVMLSGGEPTLHDVKPRKRRRSPVPAAGTGSPRRTRRRPRSRP